MHDNTHLGDTPPIRVIVGNWIDRSVFRSNYESHLFRMDTMTYRRPNFDLLDYGDLRKAMYPDFDWSLTWQPNHPHHEQARAYDRTVIDVAADRMTRDEHLVLSICDDEALGLHIYPSEQRILMLLNDFAAATYIKQHLLSASAIAAQLAFNRKVPQLKSRSRHYYHNPEDAYGTVFASHLPAVEEVKSDHTPHP